MITFTTERLVIRTIQKKDAEKLLVYENNNRQFIEETSQTRNDQFYTLKYQENLVHKLIREEMTQSGFHFLLFKKDEPNEIIGRVDLSGVILAPTLLCAWLGYSLDTLEQKKGYMNEALQVILSFAFNDLGLHRIEAGAKPSNHASQHVLERIGFTKEGLSRKNVEINGTWHDHYLYAMLASDFLADKK